MTPHSIDQAMERACEHHRAGRAAEAETLYRWVLGVQRDHPTALHMLGLLASGAGQAGLASELIGRAVALDPGCAEAHADFGDALLEAGRLDEALAAYRRAIELRPNFPEAYNSLGNAHRAGGELDAAIEAFRQGLRSDPEHGPTHYNLGNALQSAGRFDEAIIAYQEAIRLMPEFADAPNNLGNVLQAKGQFDEAIAAYRQAIHLAPDSARAYNNLGCALRSKGRIDEAIEAFREALRLDSSSGETLRNFGSTLARAGRLDEALAAYDRKLALQPEDAESDSYRIFLLHHHPDYDAMALLREHRAWNDRHARGLQRFIQPHANERTPGRRLRIGYVSPNFCEHVVASNLLPLFREHDREQFQIFAYANVPRPDAITDQFRALSDGWRNIADLDDEQAAAQIRADRIDILVDLALHTDQNRLLLFARKPAPVQVTYLGYCSTTGLESMDYRLSDWHIDPPGVDLGCYSEETIRLPRSYWCYEPNGPAPEVSALPALSAGGVTFGCLNNAAKLSIPAFGLWMEILRRVPGSRLLLHATSDACRNDLQEQMALGGIPEDRCEWITRQPWDQYMRTLRRIDVALDTFPYGGGITTCDALWMGVPVVTLSGRTAVGRGGRSILYNIGLPELVAETPEEYVENAVALANDLPRLRELRRTLRERVEGSPLRDAKGFALEIEAAFRKMFQRWCEKGGS